MPMNYLEIIICLIITALDAIIKMVVENNLVYISIIPNFLSLLKVRNYGVAFSFLENARWLIIALSVFIIIFFNSLSKDMPETTSKKIAFGIVYGGIFGNLLDRIFRGYVVDYLSFTIFNYDFPVFNLADICIVVGIFLIFFLYSRKTSSKK